MSRRGNCWDNAPQESFFGHMKDHIGKKIAAATEYEQVRAIVDDYMDYYNNGRYQWELAKLSPNEYYQFCTTGIYPLKAITAPAVPTIEKKPEELGAAVETAEASGAGTEARDSTLAARSADGQPLTQ